MKTKLGTAPFFIIVDLDNTVIDTAIRKQRLLETKYEQEVDIKTVRSDYWLESVFGKNSKVATSFFESLDSPDCIRDIDAPLFDGTAETIKVFRDSGYRVLFLTARPKSLEKATLKELNEKGIECTANELLMPESRIQLEKHEQEFKSEILREVLSMGLIAAVIGDRPSEILGAQEIMIPAILFTSTMSRNEIASLYSFETVGISEASDWYSIRNKFYEFQQGREQMQIMRKMFTQQYSNWLKDIDGKLGIVSVIGAAIIAYCGHQLTIIAPGGFEFYLLVLALFVATLSLIYAIRGLTSRHTSGPKASLGFATHAMQWFSILFGRPRDKMYLINDAIDMYNRTRDASTVSQMTAHSKLFFDHYKTYNPEILMNLRLLELKSANYSKLYPEVIASKLLIFSIVILLVRFLYQIYCTLFGANTC